MEQQSSVAGETAKEEKSGSGQLVQMRLQRRTMDRLGALEKLTGQNNKTQLVSTSIELAETILQSMEDGAKVYIEGKDGVRELLKIIGIKK